jgi:hypothetical protein
MPTAAALWVDFEGASFSRIRRQAESTRMRRLFLIASVIFASHSLGAQKIASKADDEQHLFRATDESVKHPVPLPPAVLAELARDPDLGAVLKAESLTPDNLPASWFLVSEIHLGGPAEKDLVVIGVGPVRGANVTKFWLFRARNADYELLLSAPALGLEIKKSRTNGYRNIELASATASQLSTLECTFRGGVYQPGKRHARPISYPPYAALICFRTNARSCLTASSSPSGE